MRGHYKYLTGHAPPSQMGMLIICEKNIAAQRIAGILSGGQVRKSALHGVPTYIFEWEGKEVVAVGLKGHIVGLDYPEKYNRWYGTDPRTLIAVEPVRVVEERDIAQALGDLARAAEEVVVATDFDREGELIGVEALEFITAARPDMPVKRARFSAITREEVFSAFTHAAAVDGHLADSARTRQLVDLVWGATLTRFISLASGRTGQDFLSVGRVQTPTLALIVEREEAIQRFQPKQYWEVVAHLHKSDDFTALHSKERFWDKAEADGVLGRVGSAHEAAVAEVKRARKSEPPPAPFNTTAFIAAASSQGLSAARAMSIAEDLYTNGFISYPRTDNSTYPSSLDLRGILHKLAKTEFGNCATALMARPNLKPTRGGTQTTDHPPIHPVEAATRDSMSKENWKVYELVVRRFLATLSDAAVSETTTARFDINGEVFVARGLKLLEPGWKDIYPYGWNREVRLPELAAGERVAVKRVEEVQKETQPPKRYTQGSLIQEMEKLGLGTKSTRHEILQKLITRGYLHGATPAPTESGIALTDSLERYAKQITKPEMTSRLEADMDLIADGKKDVGEVVAESREMLDTVFTALEKNRLKIGKSIRDALRRQSVIGNCVQCGGTIHMMRSRRGKRFAGCSGYPKCRQTYPLPQRGKLSANPEPCPACRHPQIKLHAPRRKPLVLCVNMACENGKLSGRKPKDGEPAQEKKVPAA